MYEIRFTKQAQKDILVLSPKLKNKLKKLLREVIAIEPLAGKKLMGDLSGSYSIRLTYQDRIVYQVDIKNKIVMIERAKTYYGE